MDSFKQHFRAVLLVPCRSFARETQVEHSGTLDFRRYLYKRIPRTNSFWVVPLAFNNRATRMPSV